MTATCGCGCGQPVRPGKRFVHRHYSASRRRPTPRRVEYVRCPRCQQSVAVRDDGTLGVHWSTGRKTPERYRCPEGNRPLRRPRPGRRVSVTLDVVLPDGWDLPRFRAEAHVALRQLLDEVFVVRLDAAEEERV